MNLFLRRHLWIVTLLTVTCAALLAARAAGHLVEGRLLLDDGAAPRRAPPARPAAPPVAAGKDASAVTDRDLFCSTCAPAPAGPGPTSAPADGDRPPPTTLPLTLVATVLGPSPSTSLATVVSGASRRSGVYRAGDVIPEAGEVVRVAGRFVDFENRQAGRVERVDILGPAAPPPPPGRPQPAPVAGDLAAAIDKGVRKIDDTHYQIDRALVDQILGDPTALGGGARIALAVTAGKADGFSLSAVRPGSAFAHVGLLSGDTIRTVNGYELTSPDKAAAALAALKSEPTLSLVITRRGQPLTLEYAIR